jgi:pimeloyl-ACP methyl ester carboxylesterase
MLVQPRVAELTATCSYDRAGLGWSDAAGRATSAVSNAATLEAMLTAANVRPPYLLVGHSYGSLVVRAYAHRHPDRVAGVVLVDPIHPDDWLRPGPELERRLRGGIFLSRVGSALARVGFVRVVLRLLTGGAPQAARGVARAFGPQVSGVLGRLVGEVQKLPGEAWPIVQACWSQPKCFAAMARHLAGLPASAREVAETTLGDTPVVIISAARSWAARAGQHHDLARLSTRSRVIIADESGHWAQLDAPELVVSAIRDLVNEARATAAHP